MTRRRLAFAASGLALLIAGGAQAADCSTGLALTDRGGVIETRSAADGVLPLYCRVDLGADKPTSTHVYAVFMNNQPLQRNNDGYWIRWNGDRRALVDNHFYDPLDPPADRKITFKIVNEDIRGSSLPVSFHFGYWVGGAFKHAVIVVTP